MDATEQVAQHVQAQLEAGRITDKLSLHKAKQKAVRELGLSVTPTDPDLARLLPVEMVAKHPGLFRKKPQRSLSGVAVVAVMSSPAGCPHGKCIYCPGGPEADAPQSYTGFEPSTMRAKRLDYDPYRVVRTRLGSLAHNGHAIDKVELIIQGGTFPAREPAYQDWFVAMLYAGCNDGPAADDPGTCEDLSAWEAMPADERGARLAALQRHNETSSCRAIGLTIETKPDWCLEPQLDAMLRHGATRIELGLQALDDDVLHHTNRGHTLQDAADAMRLARDAGFKVCVHMMPGQPRRAVKGEADGGRTTYEYDAQADIQDMRRLFAEPAWRPDMIKIYPMLVVEEGETTLKTWHKQGRFMAMDTETATEVVARSKGFVEPYCRIQRVDRDIPTTHVLAGVLKSNLRQLAQIRMQELGLPPCRCIRCQEAARQGDPEGPALAPPQAAPTLDVLRYDASDGDEVFFRLLDDAGLYGFLRLRRVGTPHRPELQHRDGVAVVRELKVFGAATPLGAPGDMQHRGHGARLLEAAEAEARAMGVGRIVVIAGVGVKEYYRRHGYTDLGPYVAKDLRVP